MLDPEILKLMRCPETQQELRLAEREVIDRLNQRIATNTLKNRAGQTIQETIDSGLIRADGRLLYPIRSEIPVMLIEEGVFLTD